MTYERGGSKEENERRDKHVPIQQALYSWIRIRIRKHPSKGEGVDQMVKEYEGLLYERK